MDGGASCMVLGHDILMNHMESYHEQGFDVSSFHFRPAQKSSAETTALKHNGQYTYQYASKATLAAHRPSLSLAQLLS